MERKILFILGKDVHNKGTYRIYQECVRRGFGADVYATTFADDHVSLFLKDVEVRSVDILDEEKLEKYDYIFSAVPLFDRELFREANKYIFLNPSTHLDEVCFSGDFIFTIRDFSMPLIEGERWPIEEFNYWKSLPAMATGGAALEKGENEESASKVILFVDAGHFPFGTKKKLAEYVIEIANNCPDYEIRIKPRYLPSDINTTHVNKENLFYYLSDKHNSLPHNLKLIEEHTDMADEIKAACLVICPEGTTSYEEVILAGKKLIIFTDFPNSESMLWSERRVRLFNSIPNGLVNRIHYKEIAAYLPEGIRTNAADLKSSLYKVTNVAFDIVDAMEFIYANFISKDRFPASHYYKSSSYIQKMEEDTQIKWDDIKRRRYKSILYDMVAEKIRNLYIRLDCSKILRSIEEIGNEVNKLNFSESVDKLNEIIYEFFIENRHDMMDTAYAQSILCLAYYKKHRFSEFSPRILRCKAYYEYCLAKLDFDDGRYMECIKHLEIYFEEVDNNLYEVSYADDEGVKAMAHYYMGAALFHTNDWKNAKLHLEICDRAWNGNHIMAAEYLRKIELCMKSDYERK